MTQPKQPTVTKAALGAPLALTDEQIDQEAIPTPLDLAAAAALWRFGLKGTRWARLIPLLDKFTFDPDSGQYTTPAGALVKDSAVRSALDTVLDAQVATMRATTQALLDGTVSLAQWQAQQMQAVAAVHLVGDAVGNGGWRSLDQQDLAWVSEQIKPQYRYLVKFSVEISSGLQKLDGTTLSRTALYAQAGRQTHRDAQRRLAAMRAAGEERRNLAIADHCRTCIAQAKLGWQPFGTLRRIGDSECRVACRCWFTFRAA